MNRSNSRESIRRMTGISILTAIIFVVQIICTFVRFGPFSITLALAPIIVGSALYGKNVGGFLGGFFGVIVLVTGLLGWDGGTVLYLFGQNVVATILICVVKGAAAGYFSGLIYEMLHERNKDSILAVVVAGLACPIVNTGLFLAGMSVFFMGVLNSWAGEGTNLIYYIIFGLTGVNFLVEIAVNIVLSSGIKRIIDIVSK